MPIKGLNFVSAASLSAGSARKTLGNENFRRFVTCADCDKKRLKIAFRAEKAIFLQLTL
jgi:hypothetical protein